MAYSHSGYCVSPKMTAYNAPSPNVVTESNYSSTNRGWKAFKQLGGGNPWYYNSTAANQWIKLDVGSGNTIYVNSYTLSSTPNNGTYPGMPVEWRLEASNDDSNWTELDYRSGIAAWGGSTMRSYNCAAADAYRYYRITFITKEGGTNGWQVDEIELLDSPDTPAIISQIALEILATDLGTAQAKFSQIALEILAEDLPEPSFKPYWIPQQHRIIGGGVI